MLVIAYVPLCLIVLALMYTEKGLILVSLDMGSNSQSR